MARRRKGRLAAMLLALAAVLSLAACGGPNFDALKDDLKFGDEEISDVMTTYSMKIPQNKPGKLIRSPQYEEPRERDCRRRIREGLLHREPFRAVRRAQRDQLADLRRRRVGGLGNLDIRLVHEIV